MMNHIITINKVINNELIDTLFRLDHRNIIKGGENSLDAYCRKPISLMGSFVVRSLINTRCSQNKKSGTKSIKKKC